MAVEDSFTRAGVRHGTPQGHDKHIRDGERPCDACATARREYDQRRRDAPAYVLKSRAHSRAQSRTQTVLKRRHSEEYLELYRWFKAHPDAAAGDIPDEIGLEP